jgi:hypothetical protein
VAARSVQCLPLSTDFRHIPEMLHTSTERPTRRNAARADRYVHGRLLLDSWTGLCSVRQTAVRLRTDWGTGFSRGRRHVFRRLPQVGTLDVMGDVTRPVRISLSEAPCLLHCFCHVLYVLCTAASKLISCSCTRTTMFGLLHFFDMCSTVGSL